MNRLVYLFLLIVIVLPGKAQKNMPLVQRIGEKMEKYNQLVRIEKVYLITDKERYMPGEIIWFSGYIFDTSSGRLSTGTRELTVNLYDDTGKLISGEIYAVYNGNMNGDILLPEKLHPGRYFIVAYTPFMNQPEAVFSKGIVVWKFYESDVLVSFPEPDHIFEAGKEAMVKVMVSDFSGRPVDRFLIDYRFLHGDKILSDGKVRSSGGKVSVPVSVPAQTGSIPVELLISHPRNLWTKKRTLKTNADEINLKFYVEGGHLSPGFARKTGFYATAWNGVPVELEAEVISSSGTLLSKVKTAPAGYGIFSYQPTPSQKDKLVITSDYGKGQEYTLPGPGEPGVTWALGKTEGGYVTADLLVTENKSRNLVVTATKGYRLLWAADTEISHNSRIRIPVNELEPGIVRLNAFSEEGELLTSRLVNMPDSRQLKVKIDAVTDEPGKVRITVKTSDENGNPLPASLALSIADSMWRDEPMVRLHDFILTGGELVNSPMGIPVQGGQPPVSAMDIILINNSPLIPFPGIVTSTKESVLPEQVANDTGISGRVTDKKGNPAPGARVTMLNSRNMQMYAVVAGKDGSFDYRFPSPVDRNDLTISAVGANGKGNLPVKTDASFSEKAGNSVKNSGYLYRPEPGPENIARYLTRNPFLISEPPASEPLPAGKKQPREEPYKVLLQSATSLLDVIRVIRPFSIINNQIVFYGTINSIVAQSGALIVIDGQKMGTQIDVLNTLNTHDIDKINISLDPMDIQKYTGFNNVGIVEIETKRGEMVAASGPVERQEVLTRDGFRIPRNFLTSDALRPGKGHDLRTTLYWNANLQTGQSGTTTFSIPLSDIKSVFIITAEGIGENGTAGYGRNVFIVK